MNKIDNFARNMMLENIKFEETPKSARTFPQSFIQNVMYKIRSIFVYMAVTDHEKKYAELKSQVIQLKTVMNSERPDLTSLQLTALVINKIKHGTAPFVQEMKTLATPTKKTVTFSEEPTVHVYPKEMTAEEAGIQRQIDRLEKKLDKRDEKSQKWMKNVVESLVTLKEKLREAKAKRTGSSQNPLNVSTTVTKKVTFDEEPTVHSYSKDASVQAEQIEKDIDQL